ncbi:AAS bifunctional protein [Paenibacillus mucilaginosus 3016]|uniref:AAS bifunctional protein n=1 Tax=Paenibacillus mucilaginosus 3016 TaxID=1116391 RepID=H6NSK3_9BACL|nr:AMP-binding protein [Paenibacillus mucilaginosus]AFC27424.1 AAS bifunctional protein [Paenibacillus mucilaginosus 3016]WFA16330.1 2-acyl-glycerophospho-ethanolamine acyltransferase [Paenibacillus mucilaginosus]
MPVILWILKWCLTAAFRLKVKGLEKLDFSGPAILMPNHLSLLDAVLLALYLPKEVTFVVNTRIAARFAPFIRLRRHITVDPLNPYSVRRMVKVVAGGTPLLLFPEGRITTTGGLMKIYSGVGYIALRTGAALYPIALNGLERSKASYLGRKLRTVWFPAVSIDVGEPLRIEWDRSQSMRRQKEAAADRIGRALQEQLLRSRLKPEANLFDEVLEAGRRHGLGAAACEDPSGVLSYRKLLTGAYALSRGLAPLLQGQKTAAVLLPNASAGAVTLLALFRLGRTPALLNFSAGRQAVLDACETAEVRTVLTSRTFIEKAGLEAMAADLSSRVRVIYLEDLKASLGAVVKLGALLDLFLGRKAASGAGLPTVILFTSGSESKPKGVVLSHGNLYANVQQARASIDFTSSDSVFNALPLFHSFGLTAGTLLPLLTGMRVYLYPSPLHYKVIPELVYDRNATILFGTSTFLAAYGRTAHPYDFHALRYVVAGAEKLKDEVRTLWNDKFGIRILEGYGATETAPVLSLNTPLHYRKGTVGRFLPGIEYKLESVPGVPGGSLYVKGPNVMQGYLLHGKGFTPCPEWYGTGDIVELDGDGFVSIVARLKRFAKIGGEMISLNAVEQAAADCFGDETAAAVALPDPRKGERIVLFHTRPGAERARLSAYLADKGITSLLLPERLVCVASLPLLGSGKTDYASLQRMAAELARPGASGPQTHIPPKEA